VSEPVINQVTTKDGIKWRVCGLGYCIEHQQRWQAEVMFECMMMAKGLRNDKPAN
jgi:ribosomal protein S3AE